MKNYTYMIINFSFLTQKISILVWSERNACAIYQGKTTTVSGESRSSDRIFYDVWMYISSTLTQL